LPGADRAAPAPVAVQPEPIETSSATENTRARQQRNDLPVFAALDLGTNNCRLLVAIPGRPGQFRVIDAFSRIVRLGEGLTTTGRLGQAAMDRAVEALKVCADKLSTRDVRRSRLIATEACRSAENGDEFIDRVARETGLDLEIIDRQTEARLAVSGCGPLVERDTHGVVLFDIGGGSSEIALIDVSRHRTPRLASHIVAWTSLPVGVVSLAERFGGREVTRETFAAMIEEVSRHLTAFAGRDSIRHLIAGENFHLLGTSGTVTTLAGVHLGLARYDRRRVDGLWMDRESVDRMVEKLLGWDFEQRVANACIGADRADLVLAGCAILEAIRQVWQSERLRVADRGLREGILSELMADEGVWRRNWRPEART
jgi:exopolyphosphatase/guanosine-5'-triphosphate,3'-diphosphate pyrophosphatase